MMLYHLITNKIKFIGMTLMLSHRVSKIDWVLMFKASKKVTFCQSFWCIFIVVVECNWFKMRDLILYHLQCFQIYYMSMKLFWFSQKVNEEKKSHKKYSLRCSCRTGIYQLFSAFFQIRFNIGFSFRNFMFLILQYVHCTVNFRK